jgi:OPA family glycerol-3-phosphate transporter-like MFS transporter
MTEIATSAPALAQRRSFRFHRNSTFVALLIGYMGYYLCRQNYSEAYLPMKTALGMDKLTFGSIASFGTFLYAVGKFGTGAFADEQGGKRVFLLGLAGSVLFSALFGLSGGVIVFFGVWGLNRFFQSMGWGSLVNVMAQWFPPKEYGTAMGMMSVSYQFGGAVASVFAGGLLAAGVGWRGLFLIPALTLAAIGLCVRPFIVGSPKDVGYAIPVDPGTEPDASDDTLTYWARFRTVLAMPAFLIMCALSFDLTLIRECFTLWMPAYFADMGASASVAAFKSSVFPLLGCLGTLFAGWYSDRRLDGRRGPIIAVMLVGLTLSLAGLSWVDPLAAAIHVERGILGVALVAASGFFLLGPYSMVGGGVVALDFGGRRTAGTAAGLLDSAGYFAATLGGFGVAQLVTSRGWGTTFLSMAVLSFVAIGLCYLARRAAPGRH